MAKGGEERGSVLLTIVILMTGLVGLSALIFDWGYLLFIQRQMQNAVDAIVLAAAQELDPNAVPDPSDPCTTRPTIEERILCRAQVFADRNQIWALVGVTTPGFAGVTLRLSPDDPGSGTPDDQDDVVVVGSWSWARGPSPQLRRCEMDRELFTPSATVPATNPAVRARIVLQGLPLFFARWFTWMAVDVCAAAVAALGGLASIEEGLVPLAVPYCLFDDANGDGVPDDLFNEDLLRIRPANDSAWTGLRLPNANANDIREMVRCGPLPATPCDPSYIPYMQVAVGEWVWLNNGQITSVFVAMRQEYPPGSEVVLPVVEHPCGGPINQQAQVVGFATARIIRYEGPPERTVVVDLIWNTNPPPGRTSGPCRFGTCRVGLVH